MAHAQQQILNAVQAALVAGGTAAGARVYVDRVDPLPPALLPAILIEESADGESADTDDLDGLQQRTLGIDITCLLAAATTAPADARAFGLAVEKLLSPNAALRALARDGPRITNSRLVQSGEGDRPMAGRRQTWLIAYVVDPAAPDLIL